jgi:hypothetical protein
MTIIIDTNKITFPDGTQQSTRGLQIRQRLKNTNSAQTTSSSAMSLSAPAITDGVQIMAQTITPAVVGSTVRVSLRGRVSVSASGWSIMSVFAGTTLLGVCAQYIGGAGWGGPQADEFEFTTTSLTPIAVQVRMGVNSGTVTATLNGAGSGGSTLFLEELA